MYFFISIPSEDKPIYPSGFDENMKIVCQEMFQFKESDPKKPQKLKDTVSYIRECMERRSYVSVFNTNII